MEALAFLVLPLFFVVRSFLLCHQIILRSGFLLLPHFRYVLLLLGFIFVLFLLFDFRLVQAMTSQSQTDSVHNFIVKVGVFFFFWEMLFLFFFWFLKKISCGFLLFVLLDLQCSTGFLLLLCCSLL